MKLEQTYEIIDWKSEVLCCVFVLPLMQSKLLYIFIHRYILTNKMY